MLKYLNVFKIEYINIWELFSMTEKIETGQILQGKVTGIQPYGAFVALNEEAQGLVHISEVTHGYVKDINDHLSVGDEVTVKVLNIDEEDRKSTRLNSSHVAISYAVFC